MTRAWTVRQRLKTGMSTPDLDLPSARGCLWSHEILDFEVTVLNSTSALYRGAFLRQRSGGCEISRLPAAYLVTDRADGRRISVLAVHSP
jgi:hypothetical protein